MKFLRGLSRRCAVALRAYFDRSSQRLKARVRMWLSAAHARCLQIAASHPLRVAAGITVVVLLLAGGGGYRIASNVSDHDFMAGLRGDLEAYRTQLAEIKRYRETESLVMTRKLAGLQVHLTRMEALGSRLVERYGLDASEFSFPETPGVGGVGIPTGVEDDRRFTGLVEGFENRIDEIEMKFSILESLIEDKMLSEEMLPLGWPVRRAMVSSNFGRRISVFTGKREFHAGVDIVGHEGDAVRAVASGVVRRAGSFPYSGNLVEVRHAKGYSTLYAHNQKNLVREGDIVRKGQVIALLGSTGRSTGPHIHFEVMKNGRRLNPRPFLYGPLR